MKPYLLTEAAQTDLRDIIHYTRKQWGDAQVREYLALLEKGMARVAQGKGRFKDLSDIYPALRMAHCQHHYLFCLPRTNEPALIVAILHERMDLMARLADKLRF